MEVVAPVAFLAALLIGLVLGYAAGDRLAEPRRARLLDRLLWLSLLALLVGMGARIGADPAVLARAGPIGVRALTLAVASVAGSVALVRLAARWLP